MGASNKSGSNKRFYTLKAKTSDKDPKPFIGLQVKQNDKWGIGETYNNLQGEIISLTHSSYEFEGETKNKFIMTLRDKEGDMQLEGNFNSLAYSLFNSLAGTNNLGDIEISVWLDKEIREGKQYPKLGVKNNGGKTTWKYDWANDIPKPEKVKVGAKTVTDDSKVVEFWKKVVEEIGMKLNSNKSTSDTSENLADDLAASSDLNSTLPF